jgi:nitrogen regulatory protein PII
MKFKLIMALVPDEDTEKIISIAREKGATGSTVITSAHGEGLSRSKTFLGLTLEGQVDLVLFLVEVHLSRQILEAIAETGRFDEKPGNGIAFQLDIEDAMGLTTQIRTIEREIEDEI